MTPLLLRWASRAPTKVVAVMLLGVRQAAHVARSRVEQIATTRAPTLVRQTAYHTARAAFAVGKHAAPASGTILAALTATTGAVLVSTSSVFCDADTATDFQCFATCFQSKAQKETFNNFMEAFREYKKKQGDIGATVARFKSVVRYAVILTNCSLNELNAKNLLTFTNLLLDEYAILASRRDINASGRDLKGLRKKLQDLFYQLMQIKKLAISAIVEDELLQKPLTKLASAPKLVQLILGQNPAVAGGVGSVLGGAVGLVVAYFTGGASLLWGTCYGVVAGFPVGVGTHYTLDLIFNNGQSWEDFRIEHPYQVKAITAISYACLSYTIAVGLGALAANVDTAKKLSNQLNQLCDVLDKYISGSVQEKAQKLAKLKAAFSPQEVQKLLQSAADRVPIISAAAAGVVSKEDARELVNCANRAVSALVEANKIIGSLEEWLNNFLAQQPPGAQPSTPSP